MVTPISLQVLAVPFRLDDLSILVIIFAVIFAVAAHFLREIILGRRGKRWDMVFEKAQRYDAVQIFVHWFFLVGLVVLFITGFIIFKMDYFLSVYPQLSAVGLRNLVAYHWYFVVILFALTIFHVVYDTIIIRKFQEVNITRLDLRNFIKIARNFFGITRNYPKLEKYHPMQKMLHWIMAVVFFLLGFTGLTIWSPFLDFVRAIGLGSFEEWLYIVNSRYLHDLLTFLFVALMIGHFYFSVLIPANWKVFRGMTRGWIKYENNKNSKNNKRGNDE